MILHKAMVVVGGLGSIVGSVVGAVLLVSLLEALREFKATQGDRVRRALARLRAVPARGLVDLLRRRCRAGRAAASRVSLLAIDRVSICSAACARSTTSRCVSSRPRSSA